MFAIYSQLAAIQATVGELKATQNTLAGHVKDAEARLSTQIQNTESRVSTATSDAEKRVVAQVEKVERTLVDRAKESEGKLSDLKEKVNKAIWTTGAVGIIIAIASGAITLAVRWKSITAWLQAILGN